MSAATAGSPTRPTAAGSDELDTARSAITGTTEGPTAAGSDELDTARSAITVTTEGPTVVIAVERCLDQPTGDALVAAAGAAVGTGPSRLDIDLRGLEAYTDDGARALVACRGLGTKLPEGLHYRTGRGPGREALLAAYADDTDALAE